MSGAESEPGLSDFLVQEDLMSLSRTYFLFFLICFLSFFLYFFYSPAGTCTKMTLYLKAPSLLDMPGQIWQLQS